jgi:hypothetical protein
MQGAMKALGRFFEKISIFWKKYKFWQNGFFFLHFFPF